MGSSSHHFPEGSEAEDWLLERVSTTHEGRAEEGGARETLSVLYSPLCILPTYRRA